MFTEWRLFSGSEFQSVLSKNTEDKLPYSKNIVSHTLIRTSKFSFSMCNTVFDVWPVEVWIQSFDLLAFFSLICCKSRHVNAMIEYYRGLCIKRLINFTSRRTIKWNIFFSFTWLIWIHESMNHWFYLGIYTYNRLIIQI